MKVFGGTIKMIRDKNQKIIKEASKSYNESKKKADKARSNFTKSGSDADIASIIALEQEKIDMENYQFCMDTSNQRIK